MNNKYWKVRAVPFAPNNGIIEYKIEEAGADDLGEWKLSAVGEGVTYFINDIERLQEFGFFATKEEAINRS